MPQWNCSCPNCRSARQGLILSRTQSCVAIGDARSGWYLINASPDLGRQVETFPELQPRPEPPRNSPIAGVFLTNADLDHVLGLFSLREGGSFAIYSTAPVRAIAQQVLGLQSVLECFCAPRWVAANFEDFVPIDSRLSPALLYRTIELPGKPPPFASSPVSTTQGGHSVAYQFLDQRTGRKLLVAPDVAAVNRGLDEALSGSDAVLFDGTFWSADELAKVRTGAKEAADMGHLTVRDGSLDLLARLSARKKIYIHINNTNPILAANSEERAAVENRGLIVGEDGLEFEL
ncbi:MAG TPA: MBL fold metallo-hydrolase [Verrucomicrobiae bacterium]|nr:MBL fold metallo-hydrolase [Verrucomicrobiae bacterium]